MRTAFIIVDTLDGDETINVKHIVNVRRRGKGCLITWITTDPLKEKETFSTEPYKRVRARLSLATDEI